MQRSFSNSRIVSVMGLALFAASCATAPPPVAVAVVTANCTGLPGAAQIKTLLKAAGTQAAPNNTPDPGQPAQLLEVNVDDVTGEVLAHTIVALLSAGAYDAWASPIVMKKGRPAHTVHALCDPVHAAAVGAVLLRETGSLGMRGSLVQRWPQLRTETVVYVHGHPIRVKVAAGRAKPEHDDAAAAAVALGLPLRDVLAQAASAASTMV